MALRPHDAQESDDQRPSGSPDASPRSQGEQDTEMPKSPLPDDSKTEANAPILNPTPGAVSSIATYSLDDSAFASWCEALNTAIQQEARTLQDHVMELQKDFDDASQYIRGDYAWRKQVAAFHDRTNDVVAAVVHASKERLEQCTQSLSGSLDDTFKVKDSLVKDEMQRQVRMYEDKLRRTRMSLKKEIDRFTRLEKCLRKEETHQAKSMYDRLVHQLTLEYAAKEATLQAMLRELKVAYLTIENANTQLMETVKGKDMEIERLKKLLPKTNGGFQRGNPTTRPASAAMSTTGTPSASDAYVQSLKQSLQSANSTIEALRKQADNATGDKEAVLKKQRLAEDAAARANDELTKAKRLLSESHGALLTNRKEVETLLQEKSHWKELYVELHFQSGSHERAMDDAKRLTEAAQARVESLESERQRARGTVDGAALQQFANQWTRWRDSGSGMQASLEASLQLVDSFISRFSPLTRNDNTEDEAADRQREWETKLRLEFESKYGDMLNLRISHERKRVLARYEMLWNKRAEDTVKSGAVASKSKRSMGTKETTRTQPKTTPGGPEGTRGASLKQVLQLVAEAFNDLGFDDWASTDIDMLHDEITGLRTALQAQQKAHSELQQQAEAQALATARAELQLREKEMLLAELTDRYRVLRAHVEKLQATYDSGGDERVPLDLSRWDTSDPFTVYGHPQPMEEKRRPVRTRPVSASATLAPSTRSSDKVLATESSRPVSSAAVSRSRSDRRLSAPKPFLLSQLPEVASGMNSTISTSLNKTLQQQEDHVRSVLKADLLSLTPVENQLEDGSHVGADGILQIMQRRRHRQ